MRPDQFAQQIVDAGQVPLLMGEVVRAKTLALVLDKATVTDSAGQAVDLEALREDMPQLEDDMDEAEDELDDVEDLDALSDEGDEGSAQDGTQPDPAATAVPDVDPAETAAAEADAESPQRA